MDRVDGQLLESPCAADRAPRRYAAGFARSAEGVDRDIFDDYCEHLVEGCFRAVACRWTSWTRPGTPKRRR